MKKETYTYRSLLINIGLVFCLALLFFPQIGLAQLGGCPGTNDIDCTEGDGTTTGNIISIEFDNATDATYASTANNPWVIVREDATVPSGNSFVTYTVTSVSGSIVTWESDDPQSTCPQDAEILAAIDCGACTSCDVVTLTDPATPTFPALIPGGAFTYEIGNGTQCQGNMDAVFVQITTPSGTICEPVATIQGFYTVYIPSDATEVLIQSCKNSGNPRICSITVCDPPNANDGDIAICSGDLVDFDLNSLVTNSPPGGVDFRWEVAIDNPNVDGESLSPVENDVINDNLTNNDDNDQVVVYTVTSSLTSDPTCIAEPFEVVVVVYPTLELPVIIPAGPITICQNDAPVLIGDASGGSSDYDFTWECMTCPIGEDETTIFDDPTLYNPTFNPGVSPGFYEVRLTITDNLCNTSGSDVLQITVNPNPTADAGLDINDVCVGSPIPLGGSPTGTGGTVAIDYTYSWSPTTGLDDPTIANPTFSPDAIGMYNYNVTLTDDNGCTATTLSGVDINVTGAAITFSAVAVCTSDGTTSAAQGEFYILISDLDGTDGAGGPFEYNYTLNDVNTTGSTPNMSDLVPASGYLGPFALGAINETNGTISLSISDPNVTGGCSMTVIVTETVCGWTDDNTNGYGCEDCPGEPLGFIVAQSVPGSFEAGGTSGLSQTYVLVEGTIADPGNIVAINETGLFTDLANGPYHVYAINVLDSEKAAILACLEIDGPYNDGGCLGGFCINECGPIEYEVDCASCCEPAATCDLLPIDIIACAIPSAFTDYNDVFTDVELCDGIPSLDHVDTDVDTDCVGGLETNRTYYLFFDNNGNGTYEAGTDDLIEEECLQNIIVTPPAVDVTCPADDVSLADCTTEADILGAYTAWAADFTAAGGCNANISIVVDPLPAFVCGGAVSLSGTVTVSDDCTTEVTCSSTFNVAAAAELEVFCPTTVTIQCNESTNPSNTGTPTVEGGCSPNLDWSDESTQTNSECGQYQYTITRTWAATGSCGSTSCVQIINVVDTTPPTITCPADQTLTCNETMPAPVTSAADFTAAGGTISDNCSTDFTVFSQTSLPTGNLCPDGNPLTYTRTYFVQDACGNTETCIQTFTYQESDEGPTITDILPACYKLCGDLANPMESDVTYETDCSFGATVSITGPVIDGLPNCPGTIYQYTYTVMDDCGRTTSATRDFIIDNSGPTIECSSTPALILECGNPNNQMYIDTFLSLTQVSASSLCGVAPMIMHDYEGLDLSSCEDGVLDYVVVTFTATDACGRIAICTKTISIQDNLDPVITGEVPTICNTINCTSDSIEYWFDHWKDSVIDAMTVEDICDSEVLLVAEGDLNTFCENGSAITTVYFVATDDCGNTSSVSGTFTIENEAPEFECSSDQVTVACMDSVEFVQPNVVEGCSVADVTFVDAIVGNDCLGMVTRTWTATDECGGTTTCMQVIMILDDVSPIITCPADFEVDCDTGSIDPMYAGMPTVVDCNLLEVTYVDGALVEGGGTGEDCGQFRTQTPGGWGSNANGDNPGAYRDANFEAAFPDSLVIGCEDGYTLTLTSPEAVRNFLPSGGQPSILDDDYMDPTSNMGTFAGHLAAITLSLTFDVYDDDFGDSDGLLGNQIINTGTFEGMTVYQIVAIANDVFGACSTDYTASQLTGVLSTINQNYVDGDTDNGDLGCVSTACTNSFTRTWTARDSCGNTTTCEQQITYTDSTPPTITCPVDVEVDCENGSTSPMDIGMPTADDSCGEVELSMEDIPIGSSGEDCGQFRTQTPGGWGAPANGNNPGAYRDANFASVFPTGLEIGCGNTLLLSTAQDAEDFLPSGGQPSVLTGNYTNPGSALNNTFAGHLTAITLSLAFDENDDDFGESDGLLGDQVINTGAFAGTTVSDIVAIANEVFGGCSTDYTASEMTGVLATINENYVDGNTDNGAINCPLADCVDFIRVWTATDACGNTASCEQQVTYLDDAPTGEGICLEPILLADVDGLPCDDVTDPGIVDAMIQMQIASSAAGLCQPVDIIYTGASDYPACNNGSFSRLYYFTVTDACNEPVHCSVMYEGSCVSFCTLTQGAWGNEGGMYPWNAVDDSGVASTEEIMDALISNPLYGNGQLYIGKPNRSLTITDATCGIELLPGSGAGRPLASDDAISVFPQCSAGYNSVNSQGRLNNNLATNTIALQLNIWYSIEFTGSDLGLYDLANGSISIPEVAMTELMTNPNYTNDVYGLLDLANEILGGGYGKKKKDYKWILGDALTALTNVNEYWNECNMKDPCDANSLGEGLDLSGDDEADLFSGNDLKGNVKLLPNPIMYEDVKLLINVVEAQRYTVTMSDASGNKQFEERIDLEEGLFTYIIKNQEMNNGIYFVRIENQSGDMVIKRVVKLKEY